MPTLAGILSQSLLLIVAGLVFVAVVMLCAVAIIEGRAFMKQYKATFTESASANLADMFMFVDPVRLFHMTIAAVLIVPALLWIIFDSFLIAIGVGIVLLILPRYVYSSMRKRRLKTFEQQLPDGLQMITGGLRAGASLTIALEGLVREQAPPLSQEFELLLREQRLGVDFDTALAHMEQRLPIQDFQMLVSALRINREIGGNLAEILENLGETLRRKQTMEGKIQALTAQGKMQGFVMTGLPILLAVLLMWLEPENMGKLFTTEVGWAVLGVIVVMEILGFVFIRKITTIDV